MFRGFNNNEIKSFLEKAARKSEKIAPQTLYGNMVLLNIRQEWDEIVTPAMAEHTLAFKIEKNVLMVRADHGIFAQELNFHAGKICEKINRMFQLSIKGVKTHVGPIYSKSNKTKDIMSQDPKMSQQESDDRPAHQNSQILDELIQRLQTGEESDHNQITPEIQ